VAPGDSVNSTTVAVAPGVAASEAAVGAAVIGADFSGLSSSA